MDAKLNVERRAKYWQCGVAWIGTSWVGLGLECASKGREGCRRGQRLLAVHARRVGWRRPHQRDGRMRLESLQRVKIDAKGLQRW